jgi:F-type H+-transporting ATPase subunit a
MGDQVKVMLMGNAYTINADETEHEAGTASQNEHSSDAVGEQAEWPMEDRMDYYLGEDHLINHVQDSTYFEFPKFNFKDTVKIEIPNPMALFGISEETPIVEEQSEFLGKISFQPTKFVVLELISAILVAVLFITLARKMKSGQPVRGRFWNMLEAAVIWVRDDIARPAIGSKDATRFLPLIWTFFFYILALNLIGMIPGLGAATGSISVTAAFALVVFFVVMKTGMQKMGVFGFITAQAPHIDLAGPFKYVLVLGIWGIEVFGLFVKHIVLAVRLFANMFAGHLVLAVFVAFIGVTWNTWLAIGTVPAVIAMSLGLNLLELLVALIQAFVFAFLTALFIGAAIHPH